MSNVFTVLYRIEAIMAPLDTPFGFTCEAKDADQAEEQCLNNFPDCNVVWVSTEDYETTLQDYWNTSLEG